MGGAGKCPSKSFIIAFFKSAKIKDKLTPQEYVKQVTFKEKLLHKVRSIQWAKRFEVEDNLCPNPLAGSGPPPLKSFRSSH